MEIKRFEVWPNSVRGSIDVQCTGMLVLTDLLVPGWHATLNVEAQPIHRVDGVFRGLQIQRTGSYEVVFLVSSKNVEYLAQYDVRRAYRGCMGQLSQAQGTSNPIN